MMTAARQWIAIVGCALFAAIATPADAGTEKQDRVVERARHALDSFLEDPKFEYMRVYVQNAYAVLVVPDVIKGGFFLGAEHGVGVLLVRDPQTGNWGQPAFYSLYGGSLGIQFGGTMGDMVITVMNERAVDKLIADRVRLGADVEMAIGRFGLGVGAGTTTHFGEDLYAFSKSEGLFGGMALGGTVVAPRHDWNEAYYGRPVDPKQIVRQPAGSRTDVAALRQSLTRF